MVCKSIHHIGLNQIVWQFKTCVVYVEMDSSLLTLETAV